MGRGNTLTESYLLLLGKIFFSDAVLYNHFTYPVFFVKKTLASGGGRGFLNNHNILFSIAR